MKSVKALLVSSLLISLLFPFSIQAQTRVLNFTDREIPKGVMTQISQGKKVDIPGSKSRGRNWGKAITVVALSGKTNHFGIDITTGAYIDYWATVPGVKVWISEYPFTKDLDIQTDETGWWTYRGPCLYIQTVLQEEQGREAHRQIDRFPEPA